MIDHLTEELRNEINLEAAGSQDFKLAAFARVFQRRLEDAERIANLSTEVFTCRGPRNRRLEILGYGEEDTDATLTVLTGRYFGADGTLTLTEAKEVFARATGFLEHACDGWLESNLEDSSSEAALAAYLRREFEAGKYARFRVLLITDGIMSDRLRTIESTTTAGIKTTFEIWDQRRVLESGQAETRSEDIDVDFTRWLPEGLPCLVAQRSDTSLVSYLAIIPARVLATVFEEYGSLLLESNVRTFLSARGAVNKGIQSTLRDEPDRFLAYNNGLTTTAISVEHMPGAGETRIRSIRGWQIVNGGQTTASISHFLRQSKDRSVDGVSVQMKLVVVDPSEASSVVNAVARYANSQNRISAADLFSTHEYHIRMEQISRRLRAPAKEGQQYTTGWYYERARGQWENDRNGRRSASEQRTFELEYPKSQRLTKTDWARNAYCWQRKPHLVSRGAQSVFADFAESIDKEWQRDDSQFGDGHFRRQVALAIVYEQVRGAVLREDWYRSSPGYLANIVAYSIAKFVHELERQHAGAVYDLEGVWTRQTLGSSSIEVLTMIAREAQAHLTDESRPQANVTQWAKQQACWDRFSKIAFDLDPAVTGDLLDAGEAKSRVADEKKERALDSAFEAIERVLAVDKLTWAGVVSAGGLSPMEMDLVRLFGTGRGRVPTERQAVAMLRMFDRMAEAGAIARDSY